MRRLRAQRSSPWLPWAPRALLQPVTACSMRAHAHLTRVLDCVRSTAELHAAATSHEEPVPRDDAAHVSMPYAVAVSREGPRDHRGGRDEIGSCPTRRADRLRPQSFGHL